MSPPAIRKAVLAKHRIIFSQTFCPAYITADPLEYPAAGTEDWHALCQIYTAPASPKQHTDQNVHQLAEAALPAATG